MRQGSASVDATGTGTNGAVERLAPEAGPRAIGPLTAIEATETVAPGLDTVSFAWRERRAWSDRHDWPRVAGSPLRERRPRRQPVEFVRVGMFEPQAPGKGSTALVYAEGRLSAIVAGSSDEHRLGDVGELRPAADVVRDVLARAGVVVSRDEEPRLRRIDAVSELRYGDRARGLALLHGLAEVDVGARYVLDVWKCGGRVETVYVRGGRTGEVLMRTYDKGVESELAKPGEWVRMETQNRPPSQLQPYALRLAELGELDRFFARPYEKAAAVSSLRVTTPNGAERRVFELMGEDEISARVAERLLGTLRLVDHYGDEWAGWSTRTGQRRRRELRQLGIVVGPYDVELDLAAALRELRQPWQSESRG